MKTNPKLYFITAFFAAALFLGGCKTDDFSQVQEDVAIAEEEDLNSKSEANARTSSSITAQSVMVDLNVNAPVIEGELTWKFDDVEAEKYFSGGSEEQRKKVARDQRCTFYDGGNLVAQNVGSQNKPTIISPVNSAQYPNQVSPRTAWSSQTTGSTVSNTTIDLVIAGESVVINKGKEKYSFSLGMNSISNLKVEVANSTSTIQRLQGTDFGITVLTNDAEGTCLAGFNYFASGDNKFGNLTAQAYLKDGLMGDIIATNKFGSTEACGNTAIGVVDQLAYELGEGNYTITVSGNIKGNDATIASPFSVTSKFTVGGLGNCAK